MATFQIWQGLPPKFRQCHSAPRCYPLIRYGFGEQIFLKLEDAGETIPLVALDNGWHELVTNLARPGSRYRYKLLDGRAVPDPASRYQPHGVHGASEIVDPRTFNWSDNRWRGRPWAETVVYELHVGTFTPEGTFHAAIAKLDHLVALGVTAIQLIPVAEFAGSRNWGYDGVYPYAPASSYGAPDDLRRLVDAAHARGIMVLDVVYDHFGPDYLPAYAPSFFTDRHQTSWGAAVNYDDGPDARVVRDFVIHNAVYWLREFHFDGLRLDAIHAIVDTSEKVIVTELAERVRAAELGREIHLILENEDNEAHRLGGGDPGRSKYNAQWNDDIHHVLHTAVTGEEQIYYADYVGRTEKLGRALAEGFAFQGEMIESRGSACGEPSGALPPSAFVAFLQNHDQVGNRALGDRLSPSAATQSLRAAASVYLLLPQIAMLFMGEEWATSRPFPFFCDFSGELENAVREGRREEFKHCPEFGDASARADIPDPQALSTFEASKLDCELEAPAHEETLAWYTKALAARQRWIVPLIPALKAGAIYREVGRLAVSVKWRTDDGVELLLDANLKSEPQPGFDSPTGKTIWLEGAVDSCVFPPWTIRWRIRGDEARE